jgi:4-amino-4-deoxy-L-arabinose transferase-like glycosyltransferase
VQDQEFKDESIWYGGAKGVLFLAIILAIFFSYEVGNRNFADPDEGRYVEISREMAATGDFITPMLNGLKYFEKPALFYWLQAGVVKFIGINETSMRLWIIFFAIIGCLGVFWVGSQYYSRMTGLISAGILATNVLYYAHSRLIILDLVVSVFISGTLWCFFIAFVKKDPKAAILKGYIFWAYIFAALACLTKGLIGIVLPGIVILLWIVFTKNWPQIKEMLYPQGILAFLIIFLPWHVMMALRDKDFLHFYFIGEHFQRYFSTGHNRYQAPWFFIPILLVGLLPWTGFSLVAIKNSFQKAISKNSENIFFMCWIFGVLAFFSFSSSKLIPYILPLMPPIALITGIMLVESVGSCNKNFRSGAWSNIILFGIAYVAYILAKSEIAVVLQNPEAVLLVNIFAILLIVVAIIPFCTIYGKASKVGTVLAYIFISTNMMWLINKVAVFYQEAKKPSTKYLAELINMNKKKEDLVFCYKRYYQDFPVYLKATVGVVDFVGELEFGAKANKNSNQLAAESDFWELWNTTDKRIFLLSSLEHYREAFLKTNFTHRIIDLDKHFIVITNR